MNLVLPISDPTGVMWTIGVTGKFHFTDAVALFFDPQVGVMLAHRDVYKEQLFIPIELQFQAAAAVSLKQRARRRLAHRSAFDRPTRDGPDVAGDRALSAPHAPRSRWKGSTRT